MVNYLPGFSTGCLDKIKVEHADASLRVEEYTCERIHGPQLNAAADNYPI